MSSTQLIVFLTEVIKVMVSGRIQEARELLEQRLELEKANR